MRALVPAPEALRRGSLSRLIALPSEAALEDLNSPAPLPLPPPPLPPPPPPSPPLPPPRLLGLTAMARPRFIGLRLAPMEGVRSGVVLPSAAARPSPGISVQRTR